MEEYRQVKLKLFRDIKIAIVNLDMERPEDFLNSGAEKVFGYTAKNKLAGALSKLKIIKAENISSGIDGSEFEVNKNKFKISLPGLFNVENALAAICVGISEDIKLEKIKNALEKITKVAGRMDEVENESGVKIIIDYALTPDSMEKLGVLISKHKKPNQSLIWVFGSCGERDRGKRPIMGEIVSRYADYIIVTNEDPYGEDPMQIISEVSSGVKNKKENENFWRILDRREAIARALKLAKSGDIILVTGKGAEEIMAIGEKRIHWNDREVIEEELEKIKKTLALQNL
jgi:UDP-N-acetylmuramoyl-L-alanyl-D-glutamate--2,6-diaminopimelate ligase